MKERLIRRNLLFVMLATVLIIAVGVVSAGTGVSAKAQYLDTSNSTYKGRYKVTGRGTVTFVKPLKKTATFGVYDELIASDGTKFKVTAISANAFKGNKKLKRVIIGKNVKKIGKKAFYGCTKLRTIEVGSYDISSVGSNAFKKVTKAVVKAPDRKRLEKYVNMFQKKGLKIDKNKMRR